ncbi:MAG: hypothetical protein TREMPRED_004820 [Tremellales sp. Tagirdzhanova-0007]|nr:MAG: hypothetical protein TREMPRED_004820 [Tremellales sp. Tagirdzhanova-0007]
MADTQTAAFLEGKLLAKAMTSDLEKVEGNMKHTLLTRDDLLSWYFKEAALLDRGRYTESKTHTVCGWKGVEVTNRGDGNLGTASYFNYEGDDGKIVNDIAC